MLNKTSALLLTAAAITMMTGCAQKVTVRALQPAEISRAAETKKIAVSEFKNDKENLSGKIEAKIAQHKIDGQAYFTTLSRQDLSKVLHEQRIQNSGIIDPRTAVRVGKLMGAQAIISGAVGNPSSSDTGYYETRTKCNKDSCWEVQVSCTKRVAGIASEIRMIDTQKGDIIYADTINKSGEWSHCSDDSSALPSTEMAAQSLAEQIADGFVYKLMPHYVYYQVTLLEDPDLEYTDGQKELLKTSLAFIKQNRFDKGEMLLSKLIESTGEKSYVPIYNLAVIKEAQGKYEDAKAMYSKADALTVQPVEEINLALNHIDTVIAQNKQALSQIKK